MIDIRVVIHRIKDGWISMTVNFYNGVSFDGNQAMMHVDEPTANAFVALFHLGSLYIPSDATIEIIPEFVKKFYGDN